jgi:hypothetical protein
MKSPDLSARIYTNRQFTLINYEVELTKEFREQTAMMDDYIRNSIKGFTGRKQEKLEGKLYQMTYAWLEMKMEKVLEVDVLPVNSFTNKIKYNDYGYPDSKIKKAQGISYSNYYFKARVEIDAVPVEGESVSTICPIVRMELIIFDKVGVLPIEKFSVEKKCPEKQFLEQDFLDGIVKPMDEEELKTKKESLFHIYYIAMMDIIEQMQ